MGVDVVVAVVDTAFCGVAERVVRAGDLGEAVGCRGVAAVAVGVVFQGEGVEFSVVIKELVGDRGGEIGW